MGIVSSASIDRGTAGIDNSRCRLGPFQNFTRLDSRFLRTSREDVADIVGAIKKLTSSITRGLPEFICGVRQLLFDLAITKPASTIEGSQFLDRLVFEEKLAKLVEMIGFRILGLIEGA